MYFAIDEQGNRVHSDDVELFGELRCPACLQPVHRKEGEVRKWHFAHAHKSLCPYGEEKDYDHEWHNRMQEYFPRRYREHRFVDPETKEVHIADVFLPESNTVIEFQHSSISDEEFWSRTSFHLKEKRRLVWVFDESEEYPKPEHFGFFKRGSMPSKLKVPLNPYCQCFPGNPYANRRFVWLRDRRRCLRQIGDLEALSDCLAICVFSGLEGDVVHRLQNKTHTEKTTTVTFSLCPITFIEDMSGDAFFVPEEKLQMIPVFSAGLRYYFMVRGKIAAEESLVRYRKVEAERINNTPRKREFYSQSSRGHL